MGRCILWGFLVGFLSTWTGPSLVGHLHDHGVAHASITEASPASPASRSEEALKALAKEKKRQGFQDTLPLPTVKTVRPPQASGKSFVFVAGSILFLMFLYGIYGNTWSNSYARKLKKKEQTEATAPDATASRMREAQTQAESRAASADYGKAIHILLLQSVSELRRRLDISIALSLTSREILHMVDISKEAKLAFGTIIAMVEISYFGSHEPNKEEYLTCLNAYEVLSQSLQRQGQARRGKDSAAPRPSEGSPA